MVRKTSKTTQAARKPDPPVVEKSRYRPEFTRITEEYIARHGWDAVALSKLFGVSENGVRTWLANRADFKFAVELGRERYTKERPDAERIRQAEEALFKRVMGYESVEKKVTADEKGESETITIGQIAPDVSAIKYYLKNRCPERWTDKQDVHVSGVESAPIVMIVKSAYEADGGNGSSQD